MQYLRFQALSKRRVQHHLAVTRLGSGALTFEHTHDFPELFLVTSGRGMHVRGDWAEALVPGTLTFVLPSDVHRYRTEVENLTFYNLALEPHWWEGFAALIGEKKPRALVRQLGPVQQAEATAMISELVAMDAPSPVRLLQTVAGLWRLLSEGSLPAGLEAMSRAKEPPPEWLAHVAADWHDPELLREKIGFWQKRSGRSPEHFARSCRRYFDAPPTELLNRARVEQVKARLRAGEGKVLTLALDAGFENLGFFYRTFRRLEKCTPREWVARHAGKSVVPR